MLRCYRWCLPLYLLTLYFVLGTSSFARAQPTYKLDVRPNLKPQATLELDGAMLKRSVVRDDPGFRLQYHFKKDGKTSTLVEGRSSDKVAVPAEPGAYTVVLEVFYPAYKGGTQPKGEYKPISNVLTYRVEPGPKVVPAP